MLVTGMERQLAAVRAVVPSDPEVPVHGVLCFVDSLWPRFFRRPLVFGSVTVLWRDALREQLLAPGPLDAAAVDRIATSLRAALKPA
jgi:hypothetical protein